MPAKTSGFWSSSSRAGFSYTAQLAESLPARRVLQTPAAPPDAGWGATGHDRLPAWRAEVEALPEAEAKAVVVCTWDESSSATPLVELDAPAWRAQVEWPTALWFATLVAAARRCGDGGSVVAVVERPATLDAPGQGPVVAVGDSVLNLVRSLAATEGARRVRVNAVTTALHTAPHPLLGAIPPLASFPGRVEIEVAGAVRLLLSPDAAGITGTVVAAACR